MTYRGSLVTCLASIGEEGMSEVELYSIVWGAVYHLTQVLPGLYIGSMKDSQDQEQIYRHNISHVVSACQGAARIFQVSIS